MVRKISRRSFLIKSAMVSFGSALTRRFLKADTVIDGSPDIAVVNWTNYFESTRKALELLGGMEKFIPRRTWENTGIKKIIDAEGVDLIITNGPMGQEKLKKPLKVIAGTDRVPIEAYCASFFGLKPQDVMAIRKAHEYF